MCSLDENGEGIASLDTKISEITLFFQTSQSLQLY